VIRELVEDAEMRATRREDQDPSVLRRRDASACA
jgi:hypothetical protein